jgi:hypothetical protein
LVTILEPSSSTTIDRPPSSWRRSHRPRLGPTPLREFLQWNEQVNQYFLHESDSGKPIYLDPEAELFEHLEGRFELEPGSGEERLVDVVGAVMRAPQSHQELFTEITREVQRWKRDARVKSTKSNYTDRAFPPPVTAALVVFVLAAQKMQESDKNGKYVASTNYYEHLLDVLKIDHEYKDKLRQDFRVTEEYWEAFNWWLEDMDGQYGLPTAQTTSQRYVGLPISQAIIRQADRDAFKRMFTNYALLPGAMLSPVEMESLIDEWTGTRNSGTTKTLIKKWKQGGEVRSRIVDAAINELQAWDGEDDRTERAGGSRRESASHPMSPDAGWVPLALVPRGRYNGEESADLGIALRRAGDAPTWNLAHDDGTVRLSPRVLSSTHVYAAGYEIGVSSGQLLGREIHLEDGHGNRLRRAPRRIVLLAYDDASGAYIETRRSVPGVRHRLLVSPDATQEMIDELSMLLELTSFAGNRDLEVDGIDPDWLVIDGFVPASAASSDDFKSTEVKALVAPIQTQFTVQGGLRLPGRLKKWHAHALPDVVVTIDPAARSTFELRAVPITGEGTGRLLQGDLRGATVVHLPLDLGVDDFRIQLYKSPGRGKSVAAQTPLQSETIRLRTGEMLQDYEGLHLQAGAAHDDRPVAAVRAFGGIPEESVTVLGVDVLAEYGNLALDLGVPGDIDWNRKHHKQATVRDQINLPTPSADSCLVTGSHRMQFPTFENGKAPGRWQTGFCVYCGAVQRTPTRHFDAMKKEFREEYEARKGRAFRSRTDLQGQTVTAAVEQLPELSHHGVDLETVIDALVHMASGTSEALQALAERAASEHQLADQAMLMRDLSSLGIIEVLRDDSFRRTRWEVTPPAILTLANKRVALGGAWPAHRLVDLHNVLADLDATLHPATSLGELSTVDGASVEDLEAYEDLEGIANAQLSWWLIAGQLPNLSAVAQELPRRNMALETGPFQMYRFHALSWTDVADWSAPGLYRRDRGYHHRDYWYRTEQDVEQGTAAAVDVELGKHLLAQASGTPLIGYREEQQQLTVPLGARLPELYERAAVLASGRLPSTCVETFSHVYDEVPGELAATLHQRMSS